MIINKEYFAKWRAKNREKLRAYYAEWCKENKSKVKESRKKYREAHRKERRESSKMYYEAHREERKALAARRAKEAYAKEPEKYRMKSKKRAAENPEKVRESLKKWKAEHPEAGRIYDQRKRARKIKNGGHLSKGLANKLFKLQFGKCPCCRRPLGQDYHLDHIMPLKRGGPNEDSNIQLLCPDCNMSKHAKHPVDFMQERGFLL